jgi:hypothetical protein
VLEDRCLLDYGVQWHTFVTGLQGDTEEGSSVVILPLPDSTLLVGGWGRDANLSEQDSAIAHVASDGTILGVHLEDFDGPGARYDDVI